MDDSGVVLSGQKRREEDMVMEAPEVCKESEGGDGCGSEGGDQ